MLEIWTIEIWTLEIWTLEIWTLEIWTIEIWTLARTRTRSLPGTGSDPRQTETDSELDALHALGVRVAGGGSACTGAAARSSECSARMCSMHVLDACGAPIRSKPPTK